VTASADAEVLIAGAGLAGCAVAARLASQGASVLLLERGRFPRDKLCGEFLSPEATGSLARLGLLPELRALGPASVTRFVLTAPRSAPLLRPLLLPGRTARDAELARAGLGLSRLRLDQALARGATAQGATLVEDCRVVAIRPGAPFEVETLESGRRVVRSARVVINAAGRLGGLAGSPPPAGEVVAFRRHCRRGELLEGAVEIHAFPGGYLGLNAVEGGRASACFLARASALREAGGKPELLLAQAARSNAHLAARLEELPPDEEGFLATSGMDFARAAPSSREVFEVGDSAAMIAPVCGDGMAMALRSAELAAPHVIRALGSDSVRAEAIAAYQAAWRAELAPRLRVGRLLQLALMSAVTSRALVATGRALPRLANWVMRRTRGELRAEAALAPST
jgi:flavin-dependent dehydrogenase